MPHGFIYALAFALALRLPALAQWTASSTGSQADLRGVVFVTAQVGIAIGAGGTILRTTTGGTAWSPIRSGTTVLLRAVTYAPGGALYAVGHFGVILTSLDHGRSWRRLASGTGQHLSGVHFPSASTGYAVGAGGTILRTTNRGRTWQPQRSGGQRQLSGVFFPTPRVGYIVAGGACYLKTVNAGATWTGCTLPAGLEADLSGNLLFRDATHGLLLGGSHRVDSAGRFAALYATTDGGTTWAERQVPGSTSMAIQFTSPLTGYLLVYRAERLLLDGYSGDDGYAPPSTTLRRENMVLHTTDAGTTWKQHSAIEQQKFRFLYAFAFPTPAASVAVGEQGQVYQYR